MDVSEVQDRVVRAYARLTALRKRLEEADSEGGVFRERYMEEFHGALDHLSACGFDVEEFRLRPEDVWKEAFYGRMVVHRALLLAKLDAVIAYFEVVTAPPERPKPQIGFRGPAR